MSAASSSERLFVFAWGNNERRRELQGRREERTPRNPGGLSVRPRDGKEDAVKTYRQGDVLLVAIGQGEVPAAATPLRREQGKLVLAHGEATGHHHAIAERTVDLVGIPVEGEKLVTADEAAELYLLVHGTDPVELTHQEHATIPVDPGVYKVVRQREYAPEAIRRVAD